MSSICQARKRKRQTITYSDEQTKRRIVNDVTSAVVSIVLCFTMEIGNIRQAVTFESMATNSNVNDVKLFEAKSVYESFMLGRERIARIFLCV